MAENPKAMQISNKIPESKNEEFFNIYRILNVLTNALARIETVTPQQAVAFAAARGVRVDSRKQLLKSLRVDKLERMYGRKRQNKKLRLRGESECIFLLKIAVTGFWQLRYKAIPAIRGLHR